MVRGVCRQLALVLGLVYTLACAPLSIAEPLLWRVDHPSSGGYAYLFGSIHFGTAALYPMPARVNKAFQGSDTLVVELDIVAPPDKQAGATLGAAGWYGDGEGLRQSLSGDQWSGLEAASVSVGIAPGSLERLKPWLAAVQLTAEQVRRSGFSERYGIDRHFLMEAKSPSIDKSIVELESFAEQMRLFGDLSETLQIQFLMQTLEEFEEAPKMLESIIEAWQAGDEAALNELIAGAFPDDSEELYQKIFVRRNHNMLTSIERLMVSGEKLFVVVGAGHMVGKYGLKEQFLARQYPVIAID